MGQPTPPVDVAWFGRGANETQAHCLSKDGSMKIRLLARTCIGLASALGLASTALAASVAAGSPVKVLAP